MENTFEGQVLKLRVEFCAIWAEIKLVEALGVRAASLTLAKEKMRRAVEANDVPAMARCLADDSRNVRPTKPIPTVKRPS